MMCDNCNGSGVWDGSEPQKGLAYVCPKCDGDGYIEPSDPWTGLSPEQIEAFHTLPMVERFPVQAPLWKGPCPF